MDSYPLHIGDSGWRAVYTEGLQLERYAAIVASLAELYPKSKCLLGYDNRFLSREFAAYCAQILSQASCEVRILPEIFPTPGIASLVKSAGYDWGFVITASHNPYYYNGLKILDRRGLLSSRELNLKLEAKALEKLAQRRFPPLFATPNPPELAQARAQKDYLAQIYSHIDRKAFRNSKLKVAWDGFGGTTTVLFKRFLKDLKLKEAHLDWPEDPSFGHRRLEPDASSLKPLSKLLTQSNCQLGLATDLDGDRFAVLDERGRFVLPNLIGPLIAWYLLEQRRERGTIYQTVSGSQLMRNIAQHYGVALKEMPVGFQKMGAEMAQDLQALMGMEETGGIAYAPHLCFKDGLMAHALLLEMLVRQKKSLSDCITRMRGKFGNYHYHRVDLRLGDEKEKERWLNWERWEKVIGEKRIGFSDLDGAKAYFPSGWLLVRDSKTEPLLRLYFESKDKTFLQKIKGRLQS